MHNDAPVKAHSVSRAWRVTWSRSWMTVAAGDRVEKVIAPIAQQLAFEAQRRPERGLA